MGFWSPRWYFNSTCGMLEEANTSEKCTEQCYLSMAPFQALWFSWCAAMPASSCQPALAEPVCKVSAAAGPLHRGGHPEGSEPTSPSESPRAH